ncbi:MAG: HPP family protein [Lachnospiraceae bacterium]|nr:HPP family protein [Lachnospiraceae bacterium]
MKREHIIAILSTLALLTLFVGIAELAGHREFIFPPAAAVALGVLLPSDIAWNCDGKRVVILTTLSALAGWGIVRVCYAEIALSLAFAFLIGELILLFSKTAFTPLLSVAALPVLLGLDGFLYPVAAFVTSALTVLLRIILERTGIKESGSRTPMEKPKVWDAYDLLVRLTAVTLLGFLIQKTGRLYLAAPPLLASFAEGRRYRSEYRKTPVRTVLSFFSCALIGVLFRALLSGLLPLPLFVAAAPAVFGMTAFLLLTSPILPSAGAMTLLAFMVSEEELLSYPFQALLGGFLLFLWNRLFFKETPDRLENETANPFRRKKEEKSG